MLSLYLIPLFLDVTGNEITPLPLACILPTRPLPLGGGASGILKSFVS